MKLRVNRKLDKYLGYAMIAVFLPLTRLLGIILRRNHSLNRPPKKILFLKLLGLGSLVVATDAIQSMRNSFPSSKFILLTDRNIAEGIKPFHQFDELWILETNNFLSVIRRGIQFIFRSWQIRNLWVIDLEVYSKLTTVYSLFTAAQNRFGFILPPSSFRKNLNTHNIVFDQSVPLDDNYIAMAGAVTNKIQLAPPLSARKENESQRSYIVVNNTCSDLALVRKLPDKTFSEICKWILQHTGYQLAIAGSKTDKSAIDSLIGKYFDHEKVRIRNIAGAFDFESYCRFLSDEAVFLVTIDSGPLHIARKLGLPTISIWGPTVPQQYLKFRNEEERRRHLFVYLRVPCSPCVHIHEKLPCAGDNFCMKNIEVGEVTGMIQTLLAYLSQTDLPDAKEPDTPPLVGKINDSTPI